MNNLLESKKVQLWIINPCLPAGNVHRQCYQRNLHMSDSVPLTQARKKKITFPVILQFFLLRCLGNWWSSTTLPKLGRKSKPSIGCYNASSMIKTIYMSLSIFLRYTERSNSCSVCDNAYKLLWAGDNLVKERARLTLKSTYQKHNLAVLGPVLRIGTFTDS